MKTADQLKEEVKKSYTLVVEGKSKNVGCCDTSCCQDDESSQSVLEGIKVADSDSECCDSSCCSDNGVSFQPDYSNLKGYNPDADYYLGCGMPTKDAAMNEGDTVLDLGSGAGNDVFIARQVVGETGKVIGVDFTDAMINKARKNAEKLKLNNVEFRYGDIEDLPVSDDSVDVVISNCVLNLVPDKEKTFAEIARVLKPGGHFAVSDIVTENAQVPKEIIDATSMYVGCISGALMKDEYIGHIKKAGFKNIEIRKEKSYFINDDALQQFLTPEQLQIYKDSGVEVKSITVYGEKA